MSGDICYRGLEPQRSLDLIQSLHTEVIKGRADEWVVVVFDKVRCQTALETMNKERDWIVSHLESDGIEYLKNLPTELKLEYEGIKVHAFHATPTSLFNVVLPDEKEETLVEKMMGADADIYVYAHIHKPYIRYIKGKCIINIGSVGLPFDGLNKASYMLLDLNDNKFKLQLFGWDMMSSM